MLSGNSRKREGDQPPIATGKRTYRQRVHDQPSGQGRNKTAREAQHERRGRDRARTIAALPAKDVGLLDREMTHGGGDPHERDDQAVRAATARVETSRRQNARDSEDDDDRQTNADRCGGLARRGRAVSQSRSQPVSPLQDRQSIVASEP